MKVFIEHFKTIMKIISQSILSFLTFLSLTIGVNSFAQSYTYNIENGWDALNQRCFSCDYNNATGEVFSTKTEVINLTGQYDFVGSVQSIDYGGVKFPSQYDKNILTNQPNIEINFSESRGEHFLLVKYNPLVNQGGNVKIVENIVIKVEAEFNPVMENRTATFAPTSVLASGSWYKIGVPVSGVFKLDNNFLSNLGINTSGLNPNSINIYGNHTPKLPTYNGAYHPDDLIKNSIYIAGDGDNSFDPSDYILFYATGPQEVSVSGGQFYASNNDIDSLAYYFIHIDGSDPAQRISNQSNSITPVTHNVSSYNDYLLHESDDINLLKSGDGWFGEHFDIELSKSFSYTLENIQTSSSVTLKTRYACASKSGSSELLVSVNGLPKDTIEASNIIGQYTEATVMESSAVFSLSNSTFDVNLLFNRTSPASEAWLDYFQLNYRRLLVMGNAQILINDFDSEGVGNVASYSISNSSSGIFVWEVTDPTNVKKCNGNLSGSNYTFIQNSDSLRTFAAFYSSQAYVPTPIGAIVNQNLHALPQVDYLIITHNSLKVQADRLAQLHQSQGTSVHVVDIQSVYNEFSGGAADPVSIRWFAKMFYDRAAGDPNLMPKYLCLFGDGTYDPLNRLPDNNYLIPTYNSPENDNSVDFINSYTADDFYGLLDDTEAMFATDLLDIGIGRIPVTDISVAEDVVNKIEHYMNFGSNLYSNASGVQCDNSGYSNSFGDWRTKVVLVADDENSGQFVKDCEKLSDSVETKYPEMNVVKIYLDAYQQIVTSGGQRYPDVEEAINQNMNRGALVMQYVGHGGETGLAQERVVTIPMIEAWNNVNNMTVFISATCEFSRFDDPGRVSAGETTLTTPFGGAVALLTTTRLVYISVNTILVQNLYSNIFSEENGDPLALGEIIRRTKNLTTGSDNMRNFTLLGDPALLLGKPRPLIVTDSINGVEITSSVDTLKALSKITVSGHVGDATGTIMSSYNGLVYPTVYDKVKVKNTLGQDPQSPILPFDVQTNIIYKGKATVSNGKFTFSFVVPKDIDYDFGKGKISYYSNDSNDNSYGYDTTIIVGGVDPNGLSDDLGPEVNLYMNDPNFVNGGLTDEKPLFMAEVLDENGINTTGNGIGHDITLIIDEEGASPIILNNFYEADLDTYQSGKVSYQLSDLEPGQHTLTFKVWDVNNNSSEATLDFIVVEDENLTISHLLNYPNPFTTNTDFFFEHNQVCHSMDVQIDIFTVSGKLVKTIFQNVNTTAFRSDGINWDGRDEYGDKLGKGVYVYRLKIETPDGQKAEKIEKLVIL